MITLIENLPANIVGFTYDDEVTASDYETVLFPAVEASSQKNKELRVLCRLGDNFKGFNLGALKDDTALGFRYFKEWKKIALVSENEKLNHIVKAFSFLVPAQVKIFQNKEMDTAIKWLME